MDTVVLRNVANFKMKNMPDGNMTVKQCGDARKNLIIRLNILLKEQCSTRESKLDLVSFLIGRKISSTKDLFVGEAIALCLELTEHANKNRRLANAGR